MDEIKIDKNVPMPARNNARWLKMAKEIQVGDSFFTADFKEKEQARCGLKKYGIKVTTRIEGAGYRIWCKAKAIKAEYLDE